MRDGLNDRIMLQSRILKLGNPLGDFFQRLHQKDKLFSASLPTLLLFGKYPPRIVLRRPDLRRDSRNPKASSSGELLPCEEVFVEIKARNFASQNSFF